MCEEYQGYDFRYTTVERVRRKLQEKGFYLPTDPRVAEERKKRAKQWKEKMPKMLKRHVQEIIYDANGQGHFDFTGSLDKQNV
jgi:hypothetical protein